MATNNSNAGAVDVCTRRINAVNKNVPNAKTAIMIDGEPYKPAEIVGVYQASLDARAAALAARVALRRALADRAAAEKTRRKIDKGLRKWVPGQFGESSTAADEFGFAPKVTVLTVEEKGQAIAKAKATRQAKKAEAPATPAAKPATPDPAH
jgi:hypothetical protein